MEEEIKLKPRNKTELVIKQVRRGSMRVGVYPEANTFQFLSPITVS